MKNLISLVLFLGLSAIAYAQPKLVAPELEVQPNDHILVDIKVVDFTDLFGMLFRVYWDDEVLEFEGYENYNADLNLDSMFHFGHIPDTNFVNFLWDAPSTTVPESLPDSTILFSIEFKVIGDLGTSSPLIFGGPTSANEASCIILTNGVFDEIGVATHDGNVVVGTSGLNDPSSLFTEVEIMPNPFTNKTNLHFELIEASTIQVEIFDLMGRALYKEMISSSSGKQVIEIDRSSLPDTGLYLCTLKTEQTTPITKLIVVE